MADILGELPETPIDATMRTFEYKERFERIKMALEQIEDTIKASDNRPAIDDAVWNEFGDMEMDVCNIEETLFDIVVKLYQVKKGKYEVREINRKNHYLIMPAQNNQL